MKGAVGAPVDTRATQLRKCNNNSAMPPQKQKQSHRLTTAESILPFFHLCRWRRGIQRGRTRARGAGCRRAHTTPSGGTRRRCIKSKCDAQVPPHWRVSTMYKRKLIRHKNKKVKYKSGETKVMYINSEAQRRRQHYCNKMRTEMDISKNDPSYETQNASVDSESVHGTQKLSSTLRPPCPRGKRSGKPAGPGLPSGDCTGDDD